MDKNSDRQLDSAEIVIIGNGIAGLTAAVEARRVAPDKRIVIITDQLHPTINTPALKQFAIAKLAREQLLAYPVGTERAERIHVVSARVEEIHAQSKYLSLSGKRTFGYGSLLIATGSKPAGLPAKIPGRDFDGVMTLHRLHDYLDFRRRISEVREAVVIGGGVLANETVMGLHYWGIRVHWLIRGKTFMRNMLDETSSEMVLEHARKIGVQVHLETEVTGVMGRIGAVAGVITNQREMIPCQLVLSCTGTGPVMDLAKTCTVPILHKKGILVDDKLRTSVRDIYAAGDVAALLNPLTGEYETRAQWYSAVEMGKIAGAMMAGDQDAARPFGVQWHATHLSHLFILSVGEPLTKAKDVSVLTDKDAKGYRRVALMGNRLVGYLSMGSAKPDSLAIKQIIDDGYSVRDVLRELLKGTLDTRAFLTNLSSQAARGIVTGRLPALPSPRLPAAAKQAAMPPSAETGPLLLPQTMRQTEQLRIKIPPSERQSVRTASAPTRSQMSDRSAKEEKEQRVILEEDFGPFSGNLPAVPASRSVGESSQERDEKAQQAAIDFDDSSPAPYEEEEFSPFSGNLPAISGRGPRMDAVPSRERVAEPVRVSRSLWEYGERREGA